MDKKTILITGATGSAGREFIKQLEGNKVIAFSRDELKQHDMSKEFEGNIRYFLGDIRDKERLEMAFRGVDYVIHAAALKQVPAAEYNPFEAIKTNIVGAQNIIEASIHQGVKKVIALSTDKAVNPVNLYGASKLCMEKLFIAGNSYTKKDETKFSVVRYGNVLGSRGSVVPLFKSQRETGVLTITDKRMTRFWVSIEDAVRFVLDCLDIMEGEEIFIPKLKSQKIVDLAKEMCPVCELKEIGIRPGEKIHEVLISKDESRNVIEYDDYYVIKRTQQTCKEWEYTSAD